MITKLAVICTKQNNGTYFAMCPEIKNCFTQAGTYEEAINNLKELTTLTIKDMSDDEKEYITCFENRIFSELEIVV